MIREFVAGLQGIASAWAVATPDILLSASGVSMIFAHLIACATAHGDTFAEALITAGPLSFTVGEFGPAWLPPWLVAVFVAMILPGVRALLGQLCKTGLHGIVVGNPVFAGVISEGHF